MEPSKARHMGLEDYLERDLYAKINCSESTSENTVPRHKTNEELIVWPWMAVVANIPLECKDGRYLGESGNKLKAEWIKQGYSPVKVNLMWSGQGHSGLAVVEFGKEFYAFNCAMMFVKDFEVDKHGRKDWYDTTSCKDDKMYAWIARDEDYNSNGLVGDYLRKNGDLITLLEEKSKRSEEIQLQISRVDSHMATIIEQREMMIENFNRDVKMMREKANEQLKQITIEYEQSKMQLQDREKRLRAREALNESEKRKLDNERKMNELAILEQKMADEIMLKLAENELAILEQKMADEIMLKLAEDQRENKKLHHRIVELQLEINQMKGAIEVMKHMLDEDINGKKKLESIQEVLKKKEVELKGLEEHNQAVIIKEQLINDELQEARRELIYGLRDNPVSAPIGVKRMGELDEKPFLAAAKRHGSSKPGADDAIKLWEERLRDPNWHPFKVVTIGGDSKEMLDEGDEKIASLKAECDDDVYNAVVTALKELNEYNPSGRHPVPELWNKKKKRKASLKEGIEFILKQWVTLKLRKLN